MSTLSELIHYCNEDDPVGAVLLLGEWGCGKTYLIEKDLAGALKDTCILSLRSSLLRRAGSTKTGSIHWKSMTVISSGSIRSTYRS